MKKLFLLFACLVLVTYNLFSQVAINKDGSAPLSNTILHVKGSGENHFVIDDINGLVGIKTTNPMYPLHVIGSTYTTGDIKIENTLTGMHVGVSGIWGGTTGWQPDPYDVEGLWVEYAAAESGGIFMNGNLMCLWSPGDADILRVYDEDNLPNGDPKFLISGSGQVGINENYPTELLHVNGNFRLTGHIYDRNNFSGNPGQVLSTTAAGIQWSNPADVDDGDWMVSGTTMYSNSTVSKIGIGTTAPFYTLQVSSAMENSVFIENRALSEPAAALRSYMYDQSGNDIISSAVYGQDRSDNGFGVAGHNYWSGVGVGAWSYEGNLIEAYDGDYPYGNLEFYVDQNGNTYTNGSFMNFKALQGKNEKTHVLLKSIQSPEAWFEDFGSSTLVDGEAIVVIDETFSQVSKPAAGYYVFLTPVSAMAVQLFISNKSLKHFIVKGVNIDGSPANCEFDYRIISRDAEDIGTRFETVTIPEEINTSRHAAEPIDSKNKQEIIFIDPELENGVKND